ncbi:MAG: DUF2089 domain-containing protein [Candidatus Latescibacterota bacterium]|nr:DUF2089 domain-containing protein [Candidatus Latescibacterota bacterium]
MNKVFIKCPACGDGLYATQLSCSRCDTTVQGSFSLSAFDKLSADSLRFLEIYVKNRGNLKEMERESGESYQALRSRLNAIIGEMGFEVDAEEEGEREELADERRQILDRLDRGELGAQEAAEALQKLK